MSIINTDNIVNLDADTLTDNVKILEEKILNVKN